MTEHINGKCSSRGDITSAFGEFGDVKGLSQEDLTNLAIIASFGELKADPAMPKGLRLGFAKAKIREFQGRIDTFRQTETVQGQGQGDERYKKEQSERQQEIARQLFTEGADDDLVRKRLKKLLLPGVDVGQTLELARAHGSAGAFRESKVGFAGTRGITAMVNAMLGKTELGRGPDQPGSGEFEPADRIDWREITRGMDGDDVVAKLMTSVDAEDLTAAGEIGERHFSHLIEQLAPDRLVRIAQTRGASPAEVLFEGYPLPVSLSWSDRSESLAVTCIDKGQELCATGFRQQVISRFMRWDPLAFWRPSDPDHVAVSALPPVFNAAGLANRSPSAYAFFIGGETYKVHLFVEDGPPEAEFWHFVDALRYLTFHYLLNVDNAPPPQQGAALHPLHNNRQCSNDRFVRGQE